WDRRKKSTIGDRTLDHYGSRGTTRAACSSRSGTFPRMSSSGPTTTARRLRSSWPYSRNRVSGKPGAVHYKPDATSVISYWVVDAATTQHLRDELACRMQRVVADARNERHQVSAEMFLDDAHLTSSGNRQMALDFLDAVTCYMDARFSGPRA